MADDFIAIDISGLSRLDAVLRGLPLVVRKAVIGTVSEYLLAELRKYPPSRYVTRKAAYGKTFFSDRQRRWFFAALHDGEISVPYNRTGGLAAGWHMIGSGENVMLANETAAAPWTMGDGTRSRHEQMVGWRTTDEIVRTKDAEIMRQANSAANHAVAQLNSIGG